MAPGCIGLMAGPMTGGLRGLASSTPMTAAMTSWRHPRDADDMEAAAGRFPEHLGPDVEVEDVDLDTADVRYRGERLTEARAEAVAADLRARSPELP